ncbi:MAG: prolipoprotein diacylglyceryl transferase [Pseudomonadota bacterium]
MYPVLFKIPLFGGITIYSYGVMVALAFLAGILWITRESRRCGLDSARTVDLGFYVIVAAIVGSRILHVAVSERDRFIANPLMFFKIWEGGLVFYGGFIAAVATAIWYIKRHRMPVLLTCDVFAPGIALGHAIGRIGCFLAGCCYGRVVDGHAWYSVIFPLHAHSFAPQGLPLYPTQLMEVGGELINFSVLFVLRYFKRFDGQIFATYLMIYALVRSIGEYYRGDVERGFIIEPWLSTSAFISIFMFVVGMALYLKCWPRKGASCAKEGS